MKILKRKLYGKQWKKNRFFSIKNLLYFVNNGKAEEKENDKGFKIRPLGDALYNKFKQFGIFSKPLSIDEKFITYKVQIEVMSFWVVD